MFISPNYLPKFDYVTLILLLRHCGHTERLFLTIGLTRTLAKIDPNLTLKCIIPALILRESFHWLVT